MKKISIRNINEKIKAGADEFVLECTERYDSKLREAAEIIAAEHEQKPILLLAGPSGSGKTTTALKLDEMLESKGVITHTISLDDYFLPSDRYTVPIGKDGKPNYETPDRIDWEQLKEDMIRLGKGEEVRLPKFIFSSQTRAEGEAIRVTGKEIITFEGIHALNPFITNGVGASANTMYVSVRRRTELADGTMLHPKFHRLMRRLIRDKQYRGRAFSETLDMFKNVEKGEDLYIMPYKAEARFQIDTYFAYEPAVYKKHLLEGLEETAREYEGFDRFMPMLEALRQVDPLDEVVVPDNALCREFIGGSIYEY